MARRLPPEMNAKAVQPAYEKWQAVAIGMSRDEVVAILGDPIKDDCHPTNSPYLNYGYIQVPSCPHPRTYTFLIGLNGNGRVFTKIDPFSGRFSVDGTPSQPELIIPADGQVFSHYPRVLDIRWHPVSGVYPVTYSVELGWFPFPTLDGAPSETEFHNELVATELVGTYFVQAFIGASPGRVRVKARNERGESPWSAYRLVRFTV